MSDYHLVQRLQARSNPAATGFDRFFGLEYMGSAEFEFGELPASLKRIRSAGDVTVERREILRPNGMAREVFFVGPRAGLDRKIDDFQTWAADEMPRSKEATYFPENFEGKTVGYQGETVAWWSLGDDIAWALTGEAAENLRKGLAGADVKPEKVRKTKRAAKRSK